MRIFVLAALMAVGVAYAALAQSETFDLAKFVAPQDWERQEIDGILQFGAGTTRNGRASYGQIFLYRSRASSGSPEVNFQMEWNEKIVSQWGAPRNPQPQIERDPNGWTALSATFDHMVGATPSRVMLFTASGFGREMSIVVNIGGDVFQPAIIQFFGSLEFDKMQAATTRAASATPKRDSATTSTAQGSPTSYIFTVPDGWTRQDTREGILLTSPVYRGGEVCRISMLSMRPAGRRLADDAINIFREIFKQEPLTFYPYPWPKLEQGTSPQGWDYFVIRKAVGGRDGDPGLVGAILTVVKAGEQLGIVVATSKEPLVSNCFGESIMDLWPSFFYSLQFKNFPLTGKEEGVIRQRLNGVWISATASVGLRYEFHGDGRYKGAGAAQQYTVISSTEALRTTQAYFGDGSYSVDGNSIVLTGDDRRRSSHQFRVGQESKDGGKTWVDKLCMLDQGSTGEVCYQKQ